MSQNSMIYKCLGARAARRCATQSFTFADGDRKQHEFPVFGATLGPKRCMLAANGAPRRTGQHRPTSEKSNVFVKEATRVATSFDERHYAKVHEFPRVGVCWPVHIGHRFGTKVHPESGQCRETA